jgi:protein transport protein SEC20
MSASKQLITILEKSDWLDRMLLIAGLGFFFLVVLFILKQVSCPSLCVYMYNNGILKRIVDRGLRIAFWWTRFLPDSKGAALNDAERGVLSSGIAETVASLTTGAAAAMSTATALLSSNAQPPTSHTTPTVVPPLVETAVYMDATVSWVAGTMDVVSSTSSVEMATSSDTVDSIHDEL